MEELSKWHGPGVCRNHRRNPCQRSPSTQCGWFFIGFILNTLMDMEAQTMLNQTGEETWGLWWPSRLSKCIAWQKKTQVNNNYKWNDSANKSQTQHWSKTDIQYHFNLLMNINDDWWWWGSHNNCVGIVLNLRFLDRRADYMEDYSDNLSLILTWLIVVWYSCRILHKLTFLLHTLQLKSITKTHWFVSVNGRRSYALETFTSHPISNRTRRLIGYIQWLRGYSKHVCNVHRGAKKVHNRQKNHDFVVSLSL